MAATLNIYYGCCILAIEATVIHHKVYLQNDAVYLRVDKVFRDDVGITDVIKLYGKSGTTDCQVDVLNRFPDGTRVYLIIGLQYNGTDVFHGYVNPDAIFENLWEIAPFACLNKARTQATRAIEIARKNNQDYSETQKLIDRNDKNNDMLSPIKMQKS